MHLIAAVLCSCLHFCDLKRTVWVCAAALLREVWRGIVGEGKAETDLAALVCSPNGARRACGQCLVLLCLRISGLHGAYAFESGRSSVADLNVQMSHSVQTASLHRGTENPLLVSIIRLLLRYHSWSAVLCNVKLCHAH